jgi:hypothetical protein
MEEEHNNSFTIDRLAGQDPRLLSYLSSYDLITLKHSIEKKVNSFIIKTTQTK